MPSTWTKFGKECISGVRCAGNPRSLRHTWATLAIGGGAAIEDVSVALGHSTVDMVTNHYLETTRAVAKRVAEVFEREIAAR